MKVFTLATCLLLHLAAYGQKDQILTTSQMHKDLSILKDAFTQLHPGVYRYNTATQLDEYFSEMRKKSDHPITLTQFYIGLSQLSTKLHCGHTYLNPYNQKKAIASQVFSDQVIPLLFQIIDGKFIITHNLSENLIINKGDEILSINGIIANTIIDSLLTVSRADGLHGYNKQIDNINISPYLVNENKYALFDIYFPLFFPKSFNREGYKIIVKHLNSKPAQVIISSVSKLKRENLYQQRYFTDYKQTTGTFNWLNKKCGYLRITEFNSQGWKTDYKKFLDSIFLDLHNRNASSLIVDIRNNEGGDDDVRNEVISYLINKPINYPTRRYYRFLSITDSLLPYLSTWDNSFKKQKNAVEYYKTINGLFYKKDTSASDTINPKSNHFTGQTYLLTGATNSSSSFFMADILQQAKAAILVGEPTGGTKQGINGGQFFFLKLPNSGIEIDIPIVYQSPIIKRSDGGLEPDIKIKTKQRDIATGNDPVITYLQKILK